MRIVEISTIRKEKEDESSLIPLYMDLKKEIESSDDKNIDIKKELFNNVKKANNLHHGVSFKIIENIFTISGKDSSDWIQGQQDLGVLEHNGKKVYFYNSEGGFFIALSIKKEIEKKDLKDINEIMEMFLLGLTNPKEYRTKMDYEMLKAETSNNTNKGNNKIKI